MPPFLSPKFAEVLRKNQLDTFEKVWAYQVNWFEEPNERRDGWSGVGRIEMHTQEGAVLGGFLKKQDNHCHRTFMHPFSGVPTFQREFEMMQYLQKFDVRTPDVMFFARNTRDLKTTLLTQELEGFISLEAFTQQLFQANRPKLAKQNIVIAAVANFAHKMHAAKLQHRSFYPKHIFINAGIEALPAIATIDLEKSRINYFSIMLSLLDLAALNRHAVYWSNTRRLYFYLQYMGLNKLTPYSKWLCRLIIKRSYRAKCK